MRRLLAAGAAALCAGIIVIVALAPDGPELGPADGHDLPPVDTGRVAVGDVAPNFTLEAYRGGRLTLSELRGRQKVVLVFYRGHW